MTPPPLQRILHVEDDTDIREIVAFALEAVGGFTVSSLSGGAEAVNTAQSFDPDLLLLDVMMPGLDGPETLARLRELPGLEETPAVFMTAKLQPEDHERFRKLGVDVVLPKPFDPMTLADDLRSAWEKVHGA